MIARTFLYISSLYMIDVCCTGYRSWYHGSTSTTLITCGDSKPPSLTLALSKQKVMPRSSLTSFSPLQLEIFQHSEGMTSVAVVHLWSIPGILLQVRTGHIMPGNFTSRINNELMTIHNINNDPHIISNDQPNYQYHQSGNST